MEQLQVIFDGYTAPEASFDSAVYAAKTYAGFTPLSNDVGIKDVIRMLVVVTDADGHLDGDDECCSDKPAPDTDDPPNCSTDYSYVLPSQVEQAFKESGVHVLVLTTTASGYDPSEYWDKHLKESAVMSDDMYSIKQFGTSAQDMADAISDYVVQFACEVESETTTEALLLDHSHAETTGIGTTTATEGGGVLLPVAGAVAGVAALVAGGVYMYRGGTISELAVDVQRSVGMVVAEPQQAQVNVEETDFAT